MTVKKTAAATAAATADVKQEIYKQCIESAIATTNRIHDFRMREIDLLVNQYIDMVPREIRSKKISSFSN
jgi:hypothetical protein